MTRFRGHKKLSIVLLPFVSVTLAMAVTPNPKLLSLVPPNARMVAGTIAPQRGGQPSSFLLITHHNLVDLDDFMALSGVDSSRAIEQTIMVASDGGGAFAEHSIIAFGHFDRALIYRSMYGAAARASAIQYRGIQVLEIQPLARESDSFRDVRWLALMDSRLALFGTINIVKEELDRYLAHNVADPVLEQRLSHLRRDDATWCVATLPENNSEIQATFRLLDPRLANLLRVGDTLELGTHYGRDVEFEYEVDLTASDDAGLVQRSLERPVIGPEGTSGLPVAHLTTIDRGVRGVVKISKERYEAWKEEIMASARLRAAAELSSR
jgi:hypothetical protein